MISPCNTPDSLPVVCATLSIKKLNQGRIVDQLTFAGLREANVRRWEAVFHPVIAWNPAEWGCALTDEAGEAANVCKKVIRGDYDRPGGNGVWDMDRAREDLAKELADVVTYADLLAARMGIDLGKAVRDKFDEVSARRGWTERLP